MGANLVKSSHKSIPEKHLSNWSERLSAREKADSLRTLRLATGQVDFSSNDYLGLARSNSNSPNPDLSFGSTGSRLLTGHHPIADEVEAEIAKFHRGESALIYNSGYDANLGIFSCLAQRNDTIIYDSLIHASVRDGLRMSQARSFAFTHNDPEALAAKLEQATGRVFVAVESVYSMDGDLAPLETIAQICQKRDALLIVDEAHATGLWGAEGQGRVSELGLEDRVAIRIHTFGKALGVHGAAVVAPQIVKDFLINFSRPLIYTTALPPHSIGMIQEAYRVMAEAKTAREQLWDLISYFRIRNEEIGSAFKFNPSPIQTILIPGNHNAKQLAGALQAKGFDIRPILSPTVPEGEERLRVCLHAFNSKNEIDSLFDLLRSFNQSTI